MRVSHNVTGKSGTIDAAEPVNDAMGEPMWPVFWDGGGSSVESDDDLTVLPDMRVGQRLTIPLLTSSPYTMAGHVTAVTGDQVTVEWTDLARPYSTTHDLAELIGAGAIVTD